MLLLCKFLEMNLLSVLLWTLVWIEGVIYYGAATTDVKIVIELLVYGHTLNNPYPVL